MYKNHSEQKLAMADVKADVRHISDKVDDLQEDISNIKKHTKLTE